MSQKVGNVKELRRCISLTNKSVNFWQIKYEIAKNTILKSLQI